VSLARPSPSETDRLSQQQPRFPQPAAVISARSAIGTDDAVTRYFWIEVAFQDIANSPPGSRPAGGRCHLLVTHDRTGGYAGNGGQNGSDEPSSRPARHRIAHDPRHMT